MEITRSQIQQKVADFSYSVAKRSVQVTSAVALPAIALYAAQNAPVADGGPVLGAGVCATLAAILLGGPVGPWTVAEIQVMWLTCKAAWFFPCP